MIEKCYGDTLETQNPCYKVNIKYENDKPTTQQVLELKEMVQKILISEAKRQVESLYDNKKG